MLRTDATRMLVYLRNHPALSKQDKGWGIYHTIEYLDGQNNLVVEGTVVNGHITIDVLQDRYLPAGILCAEELLQNIRSMQSYEWNDTLGSIVCQ